MGKFDIYSKYVSINGEEYKLVPLLGEDLKLLLSVAKEIDKIKDKDDSWISELSDNVINDIHSLVLKTLVYSYPDEDKIKLDRFATINMWKLLPVIFEINFSSLKEEDSVRSG